MTLNPNDYDLDELRGVPGPGRSADALLGNDGDEVGRGVDGGLAGGGGRLRPDDVLESGQYRELFMLESARSDGGLRKPYLETVPETYAAEVTVFEWLEFLLTKAGFKRTLDALRYYQSVGWLDERIEAQLREYLSGFDEPDGETSALDRSDHVMSLVYIARLASLAGR